MGLDFNLRATRVVTVHNETLSHDLVPMAEEAGLYEILWCPEGARATHAWDIVERLETGLALLKSDPARFKQTEPENKAGAYAGFVGWLERLLEACKKNPDAEINIAR